MCFAEAIWTCVPAAKSESVALALHLFAVVVQPLEVGETRAVVELDVVENGSAVASLRHVGEVTEKLGHVGKRADRSAAQYQVKYGH